MQKIRREELYSLEEYSEIRPRFREQVMAHKQHRQVQLGDHASLYFEDRMTMHYQIQEMLRVERIFEAEGINEELDAYNPLIPDGTNWKATFMLEYDDPEQRAVELRRLLGVEDRVWVQVQGFDRVYAIADEDLERSTGDKTSSVHFLRFELSNGMIGALKDNVPFSIGIDHPVLTVQVDDLPVATRASLCADLDAGN